MENSSDTLTPQVLYMKGFSMKGRTSGLGNSNEAAMRLCDSAKWADWTVAHLTAPSPHRLTLTSVSLVEHFDLLLHCLLLLFAILLDIGCAIW